MTLSSDDIINQCRELYQRVVQGDFDYQRDRATLLDFQHQLGGTDWMGHSTVSNMLGILSVYAGYLQAAIPHFKNAASAYERADDTPRAAMVYANLAEAFRVLGQWDDALDQVRIGQELHLSHAPSDPTGSFFSLKVNAASLHFVLRHDDLAEMTLRSLVRTRVPTPTLLHLNGQIQAWRMLAWLSIAREEWSSAAEALSHAAIILADFDSPVLHSSWNISAAILAELSPDAMPHPADYYRMAVFASVGATVPTQVLLHLAGEIQDIAAIGQRDRAQWLIDFARTELGAHFTPDLAAVYARL